jgi:phosphatidylglycerol:prolipoprotein diacylglycerol transferase
VWFSRRRHRDGEVIAMYTLLYAIGRFILEFFRGDTDRGFVFGGALSVSQFIAVIMFVIAGILIVVRHRARTLTTN